MKIMDIVELDLSISNYLKSYISLNKLSVKEKIKTYKQIFNEDVEVMQFFIQIEFYNPCSHEMDWRIIGENNEEVLGEESAKMFLTPTQAQLWIDESDEALIWKPCNFIIRESNYTIKL